jgi:hypothetical protein
MKDIIGKIQEFAGQQKKNRTNSGVAGHDIIIVFKTLSCTATTTV